MDADFWGDLAKAQGLKLPQWHVPPTPGKMAVWLRKLSIPTAAYLEWAGYKNLRDFSRLNADWPLRALVGLLIEHRDDILEQYAQTHDSGATD